MGVFRKLGSNGDTAVMWKPESKAEVKAAESAYDAARKAGLATYEVKDGESELIREFNPNAEEIVAFAPIVGG